MIQRRRLTSVAARVTLPSRLPELQNEKKRWGSAVDDQRIYVAVNNSGQTAWAPNGSATVGGAWRALDKNTGQTLWQTVTPDLIPGLGA